MPPATVRRQSRPTDTVSGVPPACHGRGRGRSVPRPAGRLALLLLVAGFLLAAGTVGWARDCPECGAKGLPELSMFCPSCQASLHSPRSQRAARATAVLIVEIRYDGDQPDRLPPYGKLSINRTYRGNLPLIDKEARSAVGVAGRRGLGADYTAVYRGEWRNLDVGLVEVTVEMKFRRAYGWARSLKRLTFPHVSLKSGEKTFLQYSFSSAREFGQPPKKKDPAAGPPAAGGDAVRLQTGSGTVGLEVPVFP